MSFIFEFVTIALLICIVMLLLIAAFAHNTIIQKVRGFDMTPELKREAATVEFCVMYNISSTECDQIYGSIPK